MVEEVIKMFEKQIYEWRRQMNKLLSNINLVEMRIGGLNEVSFDFLNTFDGKFINTLTCNNVVKLNYEISGDDTFAYFIGEVYSKKLSIEETKEAFKFFSFGFEKSNYEELFLISLEGGSIDIDVLCESFSFQELTTKS